VAATGGGDPIGLARRSGSERTSRIAAAYDSMTSRGWTKIGCFMSQITSDESSRAVASGKSATS